MKKTTSVEEQDGLLIGHLPQETSVAPMILTLTLISLVMVSILLLLTFNSIDQVAAEAQYERVRVAFDVETEKQEKLLLEYSFWNEAHQKLVKQAELQWADDNIGSYMHESHGIDLALPLLADGRMPVVFVDGQALDMDARFSLEDGWQNLLQQARLNQDNYHIASRFQRIRGHDYLLSLGLFLDEDSELPFEDGSALLIAQKIEPSFVSKLAETYKLSGLKLVDKPIDAPEGMSLTDAQASPLLHLSWEKPTPASRYQLRLLLPMAAIFLLLGWMTWHIVRIDRDNLRHHAEHLGQLASKDILTGVSNRREFFFLANREISRARRGKYPLSVLMLDIDQFRQINDRYGHSTGDAVLAEFASLIQANLRESDIFARLAGEEFVVLLPDCDVDTATETAQRMRNLVARQTFSTPANEEVSFTISIGIAVWNRRDTIDKLFMVADDALYAAKRAGSNRFVIAGAD